MTVSGIKILGLVTFLIASVAVSGSFAATLTVTTAADTVDGVCDADCSLREAVTAAAANDVIVFSPLFNSPHTITLTNGQILINKNLTINGPGANLLAVSGNNVSRICVVSDGADVALSGMTFKDGNHRPIDNIGMGGAILLTNSRLTLSDMSLTNNRAETAQCQASPCLIQLGRGGAIFVGSSSLTLINSTVSNNRVPNNGHPFNGGGGIYSLGASVLGILNSAISNNSDAGVSGGVIVTVSDSTFSNNGTSGIAGVGTLYVYDSRITDHNHDVGVSGGSELTIVGSIIENNRIGIRNSGVGTIRESAINNNQLGVLNNNNALLYVETSAVTNNTSQGGILNSAGAELHLTNATVSGNITTGPGGGLYNNGGNVTVINSTIANNRATGNGGGLAHNSAGSATIRSTIIAGNLSNTGIDVFGTIVSQGFNLIGNTAGSSGWIESDLLNQNPLLGPLADNGGWTLTHALLSDSPAIDKGSSGALTTDQRERTRPFDNPGVPNAAGGDGADIGSFEVQASLTVDIAGRVLTPFGQGLRNATVVLVDSQNNRRTATTSSFGFYSFADVPTGAAYVIRVSSRRYRFASQSITPVESHQNIDFVGQEQDRWGRASDSSDLHLMLPVDREPNRTALSVP